MKTYVLIVVASVSFLIFTPKAFAASGAKLLVCEISFGTDQEVTVRSTPAGLVLEELDEAGSLLSRPLSAQEWASRTLQLRVDSPMDSGTLKLKDGQWTYALAETFFGTADCTTRR
jgi:hypothetical protein